MRNCRSMLSIRNLYMMRKVNTKIRSKLIDEIKKDLNKMGSDFSFERSEID